MEAPSISLAGSLAAFGAALAASLILSLGMVLQKRHVFFVGHKGLHDAAFRRDRRGWLAGFVLVNLAPPFNYLALLGLPANVVAAATGSNVAFAALFSALLLGEKIGARELILSLLLFGAIAVAGLRGGVVSVSSAPEIHFVWLFILVPFALAALSVMFRSRSRSPGLAVAIGALSGAMGGFMLIPLKLLGGLGPGILAWLAAPWLWLYVGAGVFSFALVQLAYKDGEMRRVAPAYYGLQVFWPALASLFVFSQPFDPAQWVALAAIGACVALMARGK